MAGNVSAEPEAKPRMSFGLNFFLQEGALLKLLSSSWQSKETSANQQPSARPVFSKVVGSQGSGRCLANVCHDSTSGCPVQIYNRKGLWRHSSSGHPGELRPVLGCDPCHTETTSQTGTQPTRFVSSEVASVLSVKPEYFSRPSDNSSYM